MQTASINLTILFPEHLNIIIGPYSLYIKLYQYFTATRTSPKLHSCSIKSATAQVSAICIQSLAAYHKYVYTYIIAKKAKEASY